MTLQKNLLQITQAIIVPAKMAAFTVNNLPSIVLRLGMVRRSGSPPSMVPTGQIYLQNEGAPIPYLFTTRAGNRNTNMTRSAYLIYVRGLYMRFFTDGILCRSS